MNIIIPREEGKGPWQLGEVDDEGQGEDPRDDREVDEGPGDEGEEQGEGLPLVEEARRADHVHQGHKHGKAGNAG